jgi:N-methylhydantoinase B
MSGIDQWGQPYATVSLDEIASGCGAFSFRDGIDQGGTYTIPRSEAGDCEVWEQASPILYLFRRFSMGFGHGKYRGGRGIVLGWVGRGTDTQVMSAASIPLSLPGANGLWGGHCGQAGFFMSAQNCGIAQTMADGGLPGSVEKLREIVKLTAVPPKSVGVPLLHDDVWVMDIGSAGGYGDPIKRDPQAVLEDILDGLPIAQAAQIYGVIIAGDSVDAASTEQRRREIRQQRLTRALPPIQSIQRPAPNGGEKLLFQMGGELKVTEIDGRAYIVCVDCGHYLCEAAGNYKLGCGRINGSLNELDDSLYGGDACEELDDVMVYRSYICPGCGVLIENELARGDEPLFWDVRLNPRPQEG